MEKAGVTFGGTAWAWVFMVKTFTVIISQITAVY